MDESKAYNPLWPEVPQFYGQCPDDDQRLKQRIRRALDKTWAKPGEEEHLKELAETLFEKIRPSIAAMKS